MINSVSQRKSERLRRSRFHNSPGGKDISHTAQTASSPFVRGTPNCASSSLKKFINICKLSEIISIKLFHKPWDEIECTLLRSKGSCYLLVNTHETLLKGSPWSRRWLLLALMVRAPVDAERQTGPCGRQAVPTERCKPFFP